MRLKYVAFSYESGDEVFSVKTSRSTSNSLASLEISENDGIFSASVKTSDEIVITDLTAVFENEFSEENRIFLNGYQNWTDAYEHDIYGKMKGIEHIPAGISDKYAFSQYGDYNFTEYSSIPGEMHGWSYGYIRSLEKYLLIGSLSESSGFTLIKTKTMQNEIIVSKDCRNIAINGDYDGIRLFVAEGLENDVFDGWFEALGVKIRPEVKPVFGYTTWYRHFQNVSSETVSADLASLSTQKYKADVFQIDDGWQSVVGDWLTRDYDKFPDGMKYEAERITESGMIPGIWLAPFVCEEHSVIYMTRKSWLAQDEDGNYVKGGSNWSGFYALDFYNEEVREYLREVFDTIVNKWGFRFLKLDFLYAVCIQPRRDKTRGQIMAEAMDFLRECAGDAFILACGVPLASAFGKADYCRVGCDVGLDWDDKPYMRIIHRERVSTKYAILDSLFRRHLNGRAFLSDPDVFLLRTGDNTMTVSQKMALGEVTASAGSLLFTSDDMQTYGDEENRLLSGVMRMRNAEILSSAIDDDELIVTYQLNEKIITRTYKL